MSDDQVSSGAVETEKASKPAVLTWGYVTNEFFNFLASEGKEKQKRNYATAIRFFLEALVLTKNSPVGTELTEEFEAKISIYIEFHKNLGRTERTYGPRVSKIRALKRFVEQNYAQHLQIQTLPKTFGQKLLALITAFGFTIRDFWRTLPEGLVSYHQLRTWCYEKQIPSIKCLPVISRLEVILNVPTGALSLPKYLRSGRNRKTGQSDYGNKLQAAFAKPYAQWTESLEEEFKGLFLHKTRGILPEGEERDKSGQWTSSEGAGVPTAKIVKNILKSFMGYCSLPQDSADPYLRGAGISIDELSMALLADKELTENYIEFMKLRSGLRIRPAKPDRLASLPSSCISADNRREFYDVGGKYNKGSLVELAVISSLLRPGKGYLYQHPEFAAKLGSRMGNETWQEQCKQTRVRVDYLHKQISTMAKTRDLKNYEFGRDPKERIQWILDLPRPALILHKMVKDMLDDLLTESAPKMERARQYRDLVLVALLCANPLRIRMFSFMEFEKNLVRRDDGSWWLRFRQGDFKNRRALKSDYEVRVVAGIWPLLDRYKEEFHPILAGATGSRHVFMGKGKGRQRITPLKVNTLSQIIEDMTDLYIEEGIGFRPHAFRHIIATDIIKKDPRLGFFLAAIALHDKLETVETEYIHLKTSEFFEPVNTHFSEMWDQVFGSSQ
jgi:integrase